MPEGSKDASLLIATSWQALNRAIQGNSDTEICESTIILLFASFFVEANLNYLIEKLHMKKQMREFLGMGYPGLQDKLGWYYNEYMAKTKAKSRKELFAKGIKAKLRRRYPGFATIYRFRNDLSHGKINRTARSLNEVLKLRQQAKTIVDDLFNVATEVGNPVRRVVTYQQAIK